GGSLVGTMAADAERLAGELGKPVPAIEKIERAGQRDAGLEPFLERRCARRVVAAEAHAPQADSGSVEIAADRKVICRLALAGTVEHQCRDAAVEKRLLVGSRLLLAGVESARHHQHR